MARNVAQAVVSCDRLKPPKSVVKRDMGSTQRQVLWRKIRTGSAMSCLQDLTRSHSYRQIKGSFEFRGRAVKVGLMGLIVCLLQPILVYISKVDGKFLFDPVSVNFLTELAKVAFAMCMLLFAVCFCGPTELTIFWCFSSISLTFIT